MALNHPWYWRTAFSQWPQSIVGVFRGGRNPVEPSHLLEADGTRNANLEARLNELMEQLKEQSPRLTEASSQLEAFFLEISAGFEELANSTSSLFTKCDVICHLSSTSETGKILQPVIQILNRPLNFLSSCESDMRTVMSKLRQADSQIEKILRTSVEVRRTMAPLTFMQVLFRVESVRLPPELQQMFGALTEEVRRLHSRMKDTFNLRLQSLQTSRGTVQLGIARLEESLVDHEQNTASQRRTVQLTLDGLESHISHHLDRETGLALLSQNISTRVGSIVVGLQTQDILSQRLAHVLDSLTKLVKLHEAATRKGDTQSIGQFSLYLESAARIQIEHLRAIDHETLRAEKAIQDGLASIFQSISEMVQACFNGDASSVDGTIQSRAMHLNCLIELLTSPLLDTRRRTSSVCDLVVSLGGQASDLTHIIKELADSIWLSGLNAQVQSAKVAVGTGLEVLSAHTCSIADETRRVATDICTQVDSLVAVFNSIVSTLQEIRDLATSHHQSLCRDGIDQRDKLIALGTEALANVEQIKEQACLIQGSISDLQKSCHFYETLRDGIEPIKAVLLQLVQSSHELAKLSGEFELQATFRNHLEGKYSMAAEVATHKAALASTQRQTANAASPNSQPLFESPAPSIEPCYQNTASVDGAESVTAVSPNLGANVELF